MASARLPLEHEKDVVSLLELLSPEIMYAIVDKTGAAAATIARLACTSKRMARMCEQYMWSRLSQEVVRESLPAGVLSQQLSAEHGGRDLVKVLTYCPGMQESYCSMLNVPRADIDQAVHNERRSRDAEDPWDEWDFRRLTINGEDLQEAEEEDSPTLSRPEAGHTSTFFSCAFDLVTTLFLEIDDSNQGLSFALIWPCSRHWSNNFRFFIHRGWLLGPALSIVKDQLTEADVLEGAKCPFCSCSVWKASKALNPQIQHSLMAVPLSDIGFCLCSNGHFYGMHRQTRVDFDSDLDSFGTPDLVYPPGHPSYEVDANYFDDYDEYDDDGCGDDDW